LAENEAIFRAANDAVDSNRTPAWAGERVFLCECGLESCFQKLTLTREEYEAVRSHPARFFVVPGHEDLTAGEFVVEETGRYTIVEKQGDEGKLVERSDPRR
jgi:hypothetical protein